MTVMMGDTMWWQMRGGGWERWRMGNLASASAPAIPQGLPAQVAKVGLRAGTATPGGTFTSPPKLQGLEKVSFLLHARGHRLKFHCEKKRNYLLNNKTHPTIRSVFRGLGSPRNRQVRQRKKATEQKKHVVAR